MLDTKLT